MPWPYPPPRIEPARRLTVRAPALAGDDEERALQPAEQPADRRPRRRRRAGRARPRPPGSARARCGRAARRSPPSTGPMAPSRAALRESAAPIEVGRPSIDPARPTARRAPRASPARRPAATSALPASPARSPRLGAVIHAAQAGPGLTAPALVPALGLTAAGRVVHRVDQPAPRRREHLAAGRPHGRSRRRGGASLTAVRLTMPPIAEHEGVAAMFQPQLGQELPPGRHGLGLQGLGRGVGESLRGHHALQQGLRARQVGQDEPPVAAQGQVELAGVSTPRPRPAGGSPSACHPRVAATAGRARGPRSRRRPARTMSPPALSRTSTNGSPGVNPAPPARAPAPPWPRPATPRRDGQRDGPGVEEPAPEARQRPGLEHPGLQARGLQPRPRGARGVEPRTP